jgi:AraC-like DNA-binding protein
MSSENGARADLRLVTARRHRLLLVDGDLGRRATLAVALRTRYLVHAAGLTVEAQRLAAQATFDGAVLDSRVLQGALPALVRVIRKRSPGARIVLVVGSGDLRGAHYAATLDVATRLGRQAATATAVDRIHAVMEDAEVPPFDRGVGRAIDLIARDVTHLLDLRALAGATRLSLPVLVERFRAATDLPLEDYVTQVRVAVAQQLLRDTRLSMATLAELLGFADAEELAREAGLS